MGSSFPWSQRAAELALRATLIRVGAKEGRDFAITDITPAFFDGVWHIHQESDEWLVSLTKRSLPVTRFWSLDFESAALFFESIVRRGLSSEWKQSGPSAWLDWEVDGLAIRPEGSDGPAEGDQCDPPFTPTSDHGGLPDSPCAEHTVEEAGSIVRRKILPTDVGLLFDRVGSPRGARLWRRDAPLASRSIPAERAAGRRRGYRLTVDHPWVQQGAVRIERSIAAPHCGQAGGALSYRLFDSVRRVLAVDTAVAIGLLTEEALG